MQAPETFWTLFHDAAHWEFELFVGFVEMIVFDVIVGLLLWPTIKKHWQHHLERDEREKPVVKTKPEVNIKISRNNLWD